MLIGVPGEIKTEEYRVGLTPESVADLVARGHAVLVQRGAGEGMGAGDADYLHVGATLAADAADIFGRAELIVKVKEPKAIERRSLRRGQTLFTYLHLAPDADQLRELIESGATAIAYETVTAPEGGLPLLAPMSIVAGRMAAQVAARFMERPQGGRGILMSAPPGAQSARVLVLGAGTVGLNAARIALGMGARVSLLDRSEAALDRARRELGAAIALEANSPGALARELAVADAVIGAALVPGALAPRLVTRAMLKTMKPGALLVDVAIDQGGCFETSHPTTHRDPVYVVDGILHYCVANMPGAVPRTSAYALNHATLPFVRALADLGVRAALERDPHLRAGLNVCLGRVTRPEIAAQHGLEYAAPLDALAGIGAD